MAASQQLLFPRTPGFRQPATGEDLDCEAPLPEYMAYVLDRLREGEG